MNTQRDLACKLAWKTPELKVYGTVAAITADKISKTAGSGDSIQIVINNATETIQVPGSSVIGVS